MKKILATFLLVSLCAVGVFSVVKAGYKLPGKLSPRQAKECYLNNGTIYCGNGWCYCYIPRA